MRPTVAIAVAAALFAACNPEDPDPTDPTGDAPGANVIFHDALVTTVGTWDAAGQAADLAGFVREQAFDGDGLAIRDTYDGGDDQQDVEQVWERDDGGRIARYTVDFALDGDIEVTEDWTYDAEGLPALRELDANGDGRPDERSEYFVADGLLDEELFDDGADGTPDTRYLYDHDELGRQTQVYGDDFLDGRTDYTARWSWLGSTDLLVEHTRDEGEIRVYDEEREYDVDQREVRTVLADRAGGVTQVWEYRYEGGDPYPDEATWILRQNGEVVQAVEVTYRWDDEGRGIGADWAYARAVGGPIDFVQTYEITWTYPE